MFFHKGRIELNQIYSFWIHEFFQNFAMMLKWKFLEKLKRFFHTFSRVRLSPQMLYIENKMKVIEVSQFCRSKQDKSHYYLFTKSSCSHASVLP